MVVRLSILGAGRHLTPGKFLVFISMRGLFDPRAIVQLEGYGQLKNPTISGTEPTTFQLIEINGLN
jgi:hypothetical protein